MVSLTWPELILTLLIFKRPGRRAKKGSEAGAWRQVTT